MRRKSETGLIFLAAVFIAALVTAFCFRLKINDINKSIKGKIILNQIKGYNKKSTVWGDIYYTKKDRAAAETTALMLSYYMPCLEGEFDIKADRLTIIIYPNDRELKHAIGADNPPLGAYYGGIIHIASPKKGIDDFMKNGPVVHELVHYLVDKKTNGNFSVWFSEGAASYYEYKYLANGCYGGLDENNDAMTDQADEKNFDFSDEAVSYRQSFEIVRREIEENKLSIVELCEKYKKKQSALFGFDT